MKKLLDDLALVFAELAPLMRKMQEGDVSSELLTSLQKPQSRFEQLKSRLENNYLARIDGNNNVIAQDGSIIFNLAAGPPASGKAVDDLSGYLAKLEKECGRLSLSNIEVVANSDCKENNFNLDAVYVAMLTHGAELGEEKIKKLDDPPKKAEPVSALARLNGERRVVLLGGPGSGKSTFVNYLALCMAGERLGKAAANLKSLTAPLPDNDGDDEENRQPWAHGWLLPVRIVLREFAARGLPEVGQDGRARHVWDFLKAELGESGKGRLFESIQATIESKTGGLLLFDGLDEVPDADRRREQVVQAVQEFVDGLPHCRVLVTSRPYAYERQGWRLEGFAEVRLTPLSDGQVRRFIRRWYQESVVRKRVAEDLSSTRADLLEKAVFRNPRLRELVGAPLLLTMTANLHAHRKGELPNRRHALYEEIFLMLLNIWEGERVSYTHENRPAKEYSLCEVLDVGLDKVRSALQNVAYEVHRTQPDIRGTGDVDESLLIKHLSCLREDRRDMPNILLDYVRDRAGILGDHGCGVYRFPHRAFQEYLAACHLADGDYPYNLAELAPADPDRWREVTLLAAVRTGERANKMVWDLADELCPEAPPAAGREVAVSAEWGAFLAGQALAESGLLTDGGPHRRFLALMERLHAWHRAPLCRSAVLPAGDRVAAAHLISVLGAPRPEASDPDQMQFCWIPPGSFFMGSDDDPEAYDDEKPCGMRKLDYGYWLARWPVTTAQFAAFVNDETGFQPHDPDCLSGSPGAPVVNVTWNEALDFCRWLDRRWAKNGLLPKGYRVGLPSEPEWEKAARGGEKVVKNPLVFPVTDLQRPTADQVNEDARRRYPWLGDLDAERTNYGMNIGGVSPVGCYPKGISPCGCEEMVGNVWEWTRSLWEEKYPYPETEPERRKRENLVVSALRVVRGGGFNYEPGDVRCAVRFNYDPGGRGSGRGVRVVLSPFALDSDDSGL